MRGSIQEEYENLDETIIEIFRKREGDSVQSEPKERELLQQVELTHSI